MAVASRPPSLAEVAAPAETSRPSGVADVAAPAVASRPLGLAEVAAPAETSRPPGLADVVALAVALPLWSQEAPGLLQVSGNLRGEHLTPLL